jgi:hypothetical protein
MTWFKVDDSFHSHPKVLATPPAALGLWVVAGAWCSANLTDGFVPDYVLPRLLPDAAQLAEQLATSRLWRRTKGGYRFHDWSAYQPTKDEAIAARDRKSSGGTLGNHRRWHVGAGRQDANCAYCQQKHPSDNRSGTDRGTETHTDRLAIPPGPARPVLIGGTSTTSTTDRATARASPPEPQPEPPRRCPRHVDDPEPPNCGACADARRTHERWAWAEAERKRTMPKCPKHRGQPRDRCGLCRADRLAAS